MIFLEEDLPQKSQKWFDFRRNKIGASEVPILKGLAPKHWCDDYELFLRKMGKPYTIESEHIDRGNELEPIVRAKVIDYLANPDMHDDVYDRTGGFDIVHPDFKQYTAQYTETPSVFASFDGIDIENLLTLEIKCPSEKTFTKILKNRKPTIPKMYRDQIQTHLLVSNSHWKINRGIFAVFYQDGVELINKKEKTSRLIRLILIRTDLNTECCSDILQICSKFQKMIDNRQWNKHWKNS